MYTSDTGFATLLHWAVLGGHLDTVKMLVELGASIDSVAQIPEFSTWSLEKDELVRGTPRPVTPIEIGKITFDLQKDKNISLKLILL